MGNTACCFDRRGEADSGVLPIEAPCISARKPRLPSPGRSPRLTSPRKFKETTPRRVSFSSALDLAEAWNAGRPLAGMGEGVYGRVCFIFPDADNSYIQRKDIPVAFVSEGKFLVSIGEATAREMLLRLGITAQNLDEQAARGTTFKLALFDDDGTVRRATWAGVEEVVNEYFPEKVAAKLERHWPDLPGVDWVTFAGKHKGTGMSCDQYLRAEDTVLNARKFLHWALHLTELFRGDGHCMDERMPGAKGPAEYFARNRPILGVYVVELETAL